MDTGQRTNGLLLKPLAGQAILKLTHTRAEEIGGIIIPEIVRGYSWIGKVLAVTPYPSDRKVCVWYKNRRRFMMGSRIEDCAEFINETVCVSDGQEFTFQDQPFLRARLEHVLCVLPDQAELMSGDEDIPRCRRCATAGEGNVMLHVDGFCPKCGMDANGKVKEEWPTRLRRS